MECNRSGLLRDGASSNIYQQLMQREIGGRVQGHPNGFASHLFRERYRLAKNLYKTDLEGHFGCVNAIEFSHGGQFLASGGDDKRVLVWDVEKAIAANSFTPRVLATNHSSNIFCLCFDRKNDKLLSGGNDDLVIVHNFATGQLAKIYKHDSPVYGISIDPQSTDIFASASEDGRILIYDQRIDVPTPLVLAQAHSSFHAVEFHPIDGNFLVTANSKRGAAFWDKRKPHQPIIQYGYADHPPSCMSVRFNSTGSLILALSRRLPPILYNTVLPDPICTFYHGNYYNSCTMKSCTFAGEDDEFVLSGSDDFNLYVWRVSDVNLEQTDQWIEHTQMVLYGHRSIVNQVRYNRQKCLLASSGVEKIVKLWSPFQQKNWTGSLLEEATSSDNPRDLYSPYSYNSPSTQYLQMTHDEYGNRNTSEDPRMMAFFDSLIQQEIEGWNSGESSDTDQDSPSLNSTIESSDDDDDSDDDGNDDDNNNIGAGANSGCGAATSSVATSAGVSAGGHGGGFARSRLARRHIRNLVKKKNRKRCNSVWRKVKIQRNKYPNRIAYLIATKRNHLRKLAIRDASLNNRRLCRIGHNTTRPPRRIVRRNEAGCSGCSTSKLASSRRRKLRKTTADTCVSSSDDDADLDAVDGSPKNDDQTPVPSTSTGITSSLKDEMIRFRRLQQQLADSDDDDDDDDDDDEDDDVDDDDVGNVQSQNAINRVFQQSAAKTNGILKRIENSATRRDFEAHPANGDSSDGSGGSSSSSGSSNSRRAFPSSASSHDVNRVPPYRPTGLIGTRAFMRIPKHLTKHLPQTSAANRAHRQQHMHQPHQQNRRPVHINYEDGDDDDDDHVNNEDDGGSSSRQSLTNNEESVSNVDDDDNGGDVAEQVTSSVSSESSREAAASAIAPLSTLKRQQQQQQQSMTETTPIKKRKMTAKLDSTEEEGTTTADADDEDRNRRYQNGTVSSMNNGYTPDSGISVCAANTSDEKATTSTSKPDRHHTAKEIFQRKVANVKRNYRKQFANDSDSD